MGGVPAALIKSQAQRTPQLLSGDFSLGLMLKTTPSCGIPTSIRLEVSSESVTKARVEGAVGMRPMGEVDSAGDLDPVEVL